MKIKRIVLTVLSLLLFAFLGVLTGCQKEPQPLRVLIDLDGVPGVEGKYTSLSMADSLKVYVQSHGGPEDVEYEYLPADGPERSSALTRIRTEIMAGKGPDIFIMSVAQEKGEYNALFLQPEKNLELGMFYALDDYIANAQFMEWDKLTPVIMEAGRSEKWGQGILPMAYTFPVTIFNINELVHTPSKETTWDDMISDDSGIMQAAALTNYMWFGGEMLGDLADYANGELLVTEEELLQRGMEIARLEEKSDHDGFKQLPAFYRTIMAVNFDDSVNYQEIVGDSSAAFIPIYSDDGGISVSVMAYAAMNATCKRPDDAFFILDLLMSRDFQQNSILFRQITDLAGIPVYEDLMTKEYPVQTLMQGTWSMSDADYTAFCKMRECITNVKLYGALDFDVYRLSRDCIGIYLGYIDDTVEEYVHRTYTTLRKKLSE